MWYKKEMKRYMWSEHFENMLKSVEVTLQSYSHYGTTINHEKSESKRVRAT